MTTLLEKGTQPSEVSQFTDDFICHLYGRLCTVTVADGSKIKGIFEGIDFEKGKFLLANVFVDSLPQLSDRNKKDNVDAIALLIDLADVLCVDCDGVVMSNKEENSLDIDFSREYIANFVACDASWIEDEAEKLANMNIKPSSDSRFSTLASKKPDAGSFAQDPISPKREMSSRDQLQGYRRPSDGAAPPFEQPYKNRPGQRNGPTTPATKVGTVSPEQDGRFGRSARGGNSRRSQQGDNRRAESGKSTEETTAPTTASAEGAAPVALAPPVPQPPPALQPLQAVNSSSPGAPVPAPPAAPAIAATGATLSTPPNPPDQQLSPSPLQAQAHEGQAQTQGLSTVQGQHTAHHMSSHGQAMMQYPPYMLLHPAPYPMTGQATMQVAASGGYGFLPQFIHAGNFTPYPPPQSAHVAENPVYQTQNLYPQHQGQQGGYPQGPQPSLSPNQYSGHSNRNHHNQHNPRRQNHDGGTSYHSRHYNPDGQNQYRHNNSQNYHNRTFKNSESNFQPSHNTNETTTEVKAKQLYLQKMIHFVPKTPEFIPSTTESQSSSVAANTAQQGFTGTLTLDNRSPVIQISQLLQLTAEAPKATTENQ